ncbi:MAG: glycosyltransferase family 2 protein [Dermatophilaceae bacterium]
MQPARPPFFSIVTPVYNTPLDVLEDTIASVETQTFQDWEWLLVDDNSPDERVRHVLRSAAQRDARLTVIERPDNGHIVKASNDGLAVAQGEFVVLLDHDDLLVPQALQRAADELRSADDIDYLYTDENKLDDSGRFFDLFEKPVWSPERFSGHMYTCHMSVFRRTLLQTVGGFREGYDGSQDYDLVLRVTEKARRIHHIPEVLYHWRAVPGSAATDATAKPYAYVAAQKAIQESLVRRGDSAQVSMLDRYPGNYRLTRSLPPSRRVSIVIPTMGKEDLIWGVRRPLVVEAVRSAIRRTRHDNLEIVVVYDQPTPDETLEALREIGGDRLVLVHYRKQFNYSEKMNLGVIASTGDRVVLLNDDTEVRSDGWLEQLVAPLEMSDVGMTGAKMYFSDGTIQHAGIAVRDGRYHHPYRGATPEVPGEMCDLMLNREVTGVTAACAALRREVFDEAGGLSELLPNNYNDVDLSNKLRFLGYRIIWVANCELYHFESRSRHTDVYGPEYELIEERWGHQVRDDYLVRG